MLMDETSLPGPLPSDDYVFPPIAEASPYVDAATKRPRSRSLDGSSDRSIERAPQPTFLTKLWKWLISNRSHSAIHWSSDGAYLLIPDEAKLVSDVIPRLFKQKDYSSFSRQLNIYGFRRIQQTKEQRTRGIQPSKTWQHEFLTRDSPFEDLSLVRRHATNHRNRPRVRKAAKRIMVDGDDGPVLHNNLHTLISPGWATVPAMSGFPSTPTLASSMPKASAPIDITAPRLSTSAPAWLIGSRGEEPSLAAESLFPSPGFVFGSSYTTTTTAFSFPSSAGSWQPTHGSYVPSVFASSPGAFPTSSAMAYNDAPRFDLASSPLRDVFAFHRTEPTKLTPIISDE